MRQVLDKIIYRVRSFVRSEEGWDIYYLDLRAYTGQVDMKYRSAHADFTELRRIGYSKAITFPEQIRERLASGATCHVLYSGSEYVNIRWTVSNSLPIVDGVEVHVPGAIGVFDVVTPPEHRRRGYDAAAHVIVANHGKSLGARFMIGAVDSGNLPSIGSFTKTGYRFAFRLDKKIRFGRLTVVESQHSPDFLLLKQSTAKQGLS